MNSLGIDSDALVKIDPIGYDTRRGKARVTVWSYKRFSPKLTAEEYQKICIESNASKVKVTELPDKSIVHQYPNKPRVIINSRDGKLYTTKEDLEKYDRKGCEHQATILMRLLYYKYGEFIEGVSKREMPLAEFKYLQSRVEINDTIIEDDVKITLSHAGIYQNRKSNVLGFTIKVENMRNDRTVTLRPDMAGLFDDRGITYKVDGKGNCKAEPKSECERYFYVSGFKKDSKTIIIGACTTSDLKKIDFKFELHTRRLTKK